MELQKINTSKAAVNAFAESRIGGRRENQDSYGWVETPLGYLVTVCDGMGGGPGGKTASTIAVSEIIAAFTEVGQQPDEEAANILIKAIRRANMAIIDAATAQPKLHGMGSTCTALLVTKESAFVAHVGDSRVYQFRGKKKVFRTMDHSLVFELVEQGVITEEQARLSDQSNVITRALGIKPDVEVDVEEVTYRAGDRFMLCTDGIHGCMEEKELISLATSTKSKLGVVVDNVATHADNIGHNSGGGHDNLTIAVVETKQDSLKRQPMAKTTRMAIIGAAAAAVVAVILGIVLCCGGGKAPADNGQEKVDTTKTEAPAPTTGSETPSPAPVPEPLPQSSSSN